MSVRWDAFLAELRGRGEYDTDEEAERAARVVLALLGAHVVGGVRAELAARLPETLALVLLNPLQAAEPLGPDRFVRATAVWIEGATEATAPWDVGAVLSTAADAAGDDLVQRVLLQLPRGTTFSSAVPDRAPPAPTSPAPPTPAARTPEGDAMTWHHLVRRVRTTGRYDTGPEAERVLGAVLAVLGSRLTGDERRDLAAVLPARARTVFAARLPLTRPVPAPAFVEAVARALDCSLARARWDSSTVLTVLADLAGTDLTGRILAHLPRTYALLFGRADLTAAA